MQTNAPAGGEWVDQFSRAVVYGQINASNFSPERIGAISTLSRQYSVEQTIADNANDQFITTLAFPGGCLGNTGALEFNIWMSHTASITPKRIRMWLTNSATPPPSGTSTNRLVSFIQATVDHVSTMRGGLIFLTGSPSSYLTQPAASGGVGATGSGLAFTTGSQNTAIPFYLHIALQKDEVSPGVWDTVTFKYARCVATYGA